MTDQNCAQCGKPISEPGSFFVDGELTCPCCLFGDVAPVLIHPIGVVRRKDTLPETAKPGELQKEVCRIELAPGQERFLHKLDEEKELEIIFYFHKTDSVKTRFKRGPMNDGKEVGPFAARTPHRTSRLGNSRVKLLSLEGTTLRVTGLDALDNTPVLDIKAVMKQNPDDK